MSKVPKQQWAFAARFRRRAFGWRSQPAIARVREAVSEIKKAARKDSLLGAEGAVLLLEKLSPALEQVDSSSGAIGSAVWHAIEDMVPIIAGAPADEALRAKWLERLWDAFEADKIPYIEGLGDFWGELCGSPQVASRWADDMVTLVRLSWHPDPSLRGIYSGTSACLSALLTAGRNEEILGVSDSQPRILPSNFRRISWSAAASRPSCLMTKPFSTVVRTGFRTLTLMRPACFQSAISASPNPASAGSGW